MNDVLKQALLSAWRGLEGLALLKAVLAPKRQVRVAVSSSFGAESAVLLDLIAQVDRATPVLSVDTGKLFAETVAYRDQLIDHFGFTDVRILKASDDLIQGTDPDGALHQFDPDLCCQVRKVMPHAQAAAAFDVLITGRKRFHGGARGSLAAVDIEGSHIKVNPLATWSQADIDDAFSQRNLPRHPLVARGYPSIGCATCTQKPGSGDGLRSGRWAGTAKTECGLHLVVHELHQIDLRENGL